MPLPKLFILVLMFSLAACDAVDTVKQGLEHSQAVAAKLENATGSKPHVAFNWHNGALTSVQITFREIPQNAPLTDIYALARQSIARHFKEQPKSIVISFAIEQ